MNTISDDAKAIVLLCARLSERSDAEPLQQKEYTRLVRWLMARELRPSDLLAPEKLADADRAAGFTKERLSSLIGRGVQLGFALEKWNKNGIWVVCRSDEEYPARIKEHLNDRSPPVLFCAGERSLLAGGGLAIVGSRNVDGESEAFTRNIAQWCAYGKMAVVSGGARGVDQISMKATLEAGGCVIGILADSLLRKSVARDARYAIADGRLLLISPYHPDAGFTVGTAMGRNKLIYAMADYGLVVSADHNRGGTWAGAKEELNRTGGRPVFVRMQGKVPLGNKKLAEGGAFRFPPFSRDNDPLATLKEVCESSPALPVQTQDLFEYAEMTEKVSCEVEEVKPDDQPLTEEPAPPETSNEREEDS